MKALTDPLKQLPFLKIAFAFGVGIYLEHKVDSNLTVVLFGVLIGVALCIVGHLSKSYALRWVFGLGLLLFFFSLGVAYMSFSDKNPININSGKVGSVWLTVEENPTVTNYGSRWRSRIIKADSLDESMLPVGCIVYSRANSVPNVGDVVFARMQISPIQPPKNPFEFDYRSYYAAQDIYVQASIDSLGYALVGECRINPILRISYAIQRYVQKTFVDYGLTGNDLGVITALMIGDKQFLDKEMKSTYSNIGAMHMLAVSGMHVGILYEVLLALLFFLKGRRAEMYKNLIAIIILWIYAVVAGLAPSIMRATVMFSILGVGRMVRRDKNTFNILAAAFLFQLASNPLTLFNLGFQLSYAAVASILLFYPLFQQWSPRNKIANKIYDLVAVTLAAQILTLPICIYNFHQFPLIFVVTNLVLLPLITIIMYLGIALLALSWLPFVAKYIAMSSSFLCSMANRCATFLENIPYALMQNLEIKEWQMIILVIICLLMYVYLLHPSFKALAVPLLLLLFVEAGTTFSRLQIGSPQIVAYSASGKLAVLLKNGKDCFCVCDSVRPLDNYAFMEESVRKWTGFPIDSVRFVQFDDVYTQGNLELKKGWITFGDKSIFVANQYFPFIEKKSMPIRIDYLVVARGAGSRPEYALRALCPKKVVLTATMSYWQRKKWLDYCKENSIPFFDIREQGAWILSL